MEYSKLLATQIIAYSLSEFFFRRRSDITNIYSNKEYRNRGLIYLIITFCTSWILSFECAYIFGAITIVFSYVLINIIQYILSKIESLHKYIFLIGQLLKLLVIFGVVYCYSKFFPESNLWYSKFSNYHIFAIAAYLLCLIPANIYIREILNVNNIKVDIISEQQSATSDIDQISELQRAGRLIGSIERIFVLTFVLLVQYEVIGFLIAAKSILRYPGQISGKTEYVLIGTMLSFGIAIGLGLLLKEIN